MSDEVQPIAEYDRPVLALVRIDRVAESSNADAVNALLAEGFVLLSVGQDPYGVPCYVLGHPTQIDGSVAGAE